MASRNDKLLKAGVVLIIIGVVAILAGVITSIATHNPGNPASIALWVIGGALVVIGIILVSLGSGGINVRFQPPQMPNP